ncbi:nuclease-related domain-containing protein [Streptomyces sp. DSM 41014]|uniref:Nuclease-related domain-containing protein n=1 Tax=Streptomyces hintoniae TaxID=3075521 RepID=A0ABU2UTT8_9ACTN|nr:nuclease-related domain-containing protein [Streptomyces sp. DSM 41014]MDT0476232.1 nuclease-related domain-containing protein [Streptomyces sp. DSM 41014]
MSTLLGILALAGLCLYLGGAQRLRDALDRLRGRGPGASAAAHARHLRTPAVRVATALHIPTQRGRDAARWDAGAAGERRTAARLQPLEDAGWTVLHDRALPGSRANLDHVAISPGRHPVVFLLDSKRWSARPLTCDGVRLWHGEQDVTTRLTGLHHETRRLTSLLGGPVVPVVVMDGPAMDGLLFLDGITIVPAWSLVSQLTISAHQTPPHPHERRTATRARRLTPYQHRAR